MATPHKVVRKTTDDKTIFEVYFRGIRHGDRRVRGTHVGIPYLKNIAMDLCGSDYEETVSLGQRLGHL